MIKRQFIKYDIILSFTEQDCEIAFQMKKALKRKGLSVYYYKEKNQLAQDLKDLTPYLYGNRANYGLVILSNAYRQNEWPQREWEAMRAAKDNGILKGIFIVRIQKTSLPGLSQSVIQAKWKNNPKEIANQIKAQMPFSGTRTLKIIGWLFLFSLIGLLIYRINRF